MRPYKNADITAEGSVDELVTRRQSEITVSSGRA